MLDDAARPQDNPSSYSTSSGAPAAGHGRVETRTEVVWVDDDGIIHVLGKPNVEVNLDDARIVIETFRVLAGGARRPIVADITVTRSVSRDARKYLSGPDVAQVALAGALVGRSPLSTAIGNFFMGLNRPLVPTRLFSSEHAALDWLRGFLR
jgi:hypothetical protein